LVARPENPVSLIRTVRFANLVLGRGVLTLYRRHVHACPHRIMSVVDAVGRFMDDARARKLTPASLAKISFVLEKQLVS